MNCEIVNYLVIYLAALLGAGVGAGFGFVLCALLTISRDNHHDEHEEFPGC